MASYKSAYTGAQIDNAINTVINNVYNKTETDNLLNAKANTADLSAVATSGNYTDLSNKPTNLTDFNGTLPISQGGTGATTSTNARTNLEVMKATMLYNNGSTQADFTLSDSAINYTYIDIFMHAENAHYFTQRVYDPNGKSVHLFVAGAYSPDSKALLFSSGITFSGTSVAWISTLDSYSTLNANGSVGVNFRRSIWIDKIIGYSY